MTYANGCDVSAWQDDNNTPQQINFLKMKQSGVDFVFIRATYGNWVDPDFEYNWQAARAAGLLRGAYHYHRLILSATPQLDAFTGALVGDPGELGPVFDLERDGVGAYDRQTVLDVTQAGLAVFENRTGKRPIFYSNFDVILNILRPVPDWLTKHNLWIANYPGGERTAENALKIQSNLEASINKQGWKSWKFWQYSDKGDGLAHGVESKQIDCNWFNGTLADLYKYAGLAPEEKPELSDDEKLARLWEHHPELWGLG